MVRRLCILARRGLRFDLTALRDFSWPSSRIRGVGAIVAFWCGAGKAAGHCRLLTGLASIVYGRYSNQIVIVTSRPAQVTLPK